MTRSGHVFKMVLLILSIFVQKWFVLDTNYYNNNNNNRLIPGEASLDTGEGVGLVEAVIMPLSGESGTGSSLESITVAVIGDSSPELAAAAAAIILSFSRILLGGLGFFTARLFDLLLVWPLVLLSSGENWGLEGDGDFAGAASDDSGGVDSDSCVAVVCFSSTNPKSTLDTLSEVVKAFDAALFALFSQVDFLFF